MKYELSGISTPFAGISWTKNKTSKDMFTHLFLYLESKRILVHPIEMEKKEWCIESVLEIKHNLLSASENVTLDKFDLLTIRKLIDGCNTYLDTVYPMNLPNIIYKNGERWADLNFDKAMKVFRNTFKTEIGNIEEQYKLHFGKDIPEKY